MIQLLPLLPRFLRKDDKVGFVPAGDEAAGVGELGGTSGARGFFGGQAQQGLAGGGGRVCARRKDSSRVRAAVFDTGVSPPSARPRASAVAPMLARGISG